MSDVARGRQDGPEVAVEQQAQEFSSLRTQGAAFAVVEGQRAWAVGRQHGGERVARGVKLAQLPVQLDLAGPRLTDQPFQEASTALQRSPNQCEEDIVHIELAPRQAFTPSRIEPGAKRLFRRKREVRGHAAADDVVIDRQPGTGRAAQHGLADRLAIVEFVVRRGLGRKAFQVQGLDEQTIACLDRDVVDHRQIRQAVADIGFARRQHLRRAGGEVGLGHGRYELPSQKPKLRTRGQLRNLVSQMSKKRGSRRHPR